MYVFLPRTGDSNLTGRNSFRSKVGEGSALFGAQNGGGGGGVGAVFVCSLIGRLDGVGVLLGDHVPIIINIKLALKIKQ